MKPLDEKGEDDSSSTSSSDDSYEEKNSNDGDDELSEIDSNAAAADDDNDDVNETFNNQETSIDDDVNGERELGTPIDMSKLTLNDSNTDSDDVINVKPKNEVNRRRIIDDDSSSDEEDLVLSIDDESDAPAKEKAASDVSNVEQEDDAELDDLLLDGGFSGLNMMIMK